MRGMPDGRPRVISINRMITYVDSRRTSMYVGMFPRVRSYFAAALVVALTGSAVAVAGAASAASTVYEAEQATVFHGTVDADHTGYTGTGFVNSTNETGAYVEFAVHTTADGSAGLTFRYA